MIRGATNLPYEIWKKSLFHANSSHEGAKKNVRWAA